MLQGQHVDERLAELVARSDVSAAMSFVRADDERTLATQIELSEIPAPPFEEEPRASRMAELCAAAGLSDVSSDSVGNVIGNRAGGSQETPLVVSAHLDTVFPAGTDVAVLREGDLLRGPGISDDARGLTALLTLARSLDQTGITTDRPLRFVATVGEEGAGNLRGVRHLFAPGQAAEQAAGFISLDGAGVARIVVIGLGSRRYRIAVRGPGGHSWADWGTPNPLHAVADLGSRLTGLTLSTDPLATLTIARMGGGTSINAIPQEAWMEVDTRSPDGRALDTLEQALRDTVEAVRADWAGRAPAPPLDMEVTVIGSRPGGRTAEKEPLVQAAMAATRRLTASPELVLSSTDANIPMARGTPAVTLGCGGEAGQAHTTDEWFRNVGGPEGIIRALHTVLLFAGVS